MEECTVVFPVQGDVLYLAEQKFKGDERDKYGAGKLKGYGGKAKPEDRGHICMTAVREFQEESGVKAGSLQPVAVIDFYEAGVHILEGHIYFCRHWTGDFMETDEMKLPEQFPLSNPPYERMMKGDRYWFPALAHGLTLRARLYYDRGLKNVLMFEPRGPL